MHEFTKKPAKFKSDSPCHQDFRIDKDRWKLVADNADSINMALLRQQQQRLALIKALGVFCKHQAILR